MKKQFLAATLAVITTVTTALSSATLVQANEWKRDNMGWWFVNDAGNYYKSSWQNISGKWYYFDASGYMAASRWIGNYYVGADGAMLTNTITPDGYKVGLDGAWIPATTLPAQSQASQTTTTKQQSTQQNTSKANTNSSSSNFLTSTIPSGSYFVVNTSSKKYHYPSCRMVNKISNGNRKYSTDESALQANGYVPCQVCH